MKNALYPKTLENQATRKALAQSITIQYSIWQRMTVDLSRVDHLIQYALLVAGEGDDVPARQLGPIHLIKYVYLADLAFAKRNQGHTFTGVDWRFHKFGPWSQPVNERVQPSLVAIGAMSKIFESDFEGRADWIRWSLSDPDLRGRKESALPPAITLQLSKEIRKFRGDTPSLLDYVYRTQPMLDAAPGEHLRFTAELASSEQAQGSREESAPPLAFSKKRLRKFSARMAELQKQAEMRCSEGEHSLSKSPKPRLDEVYSSGIEWLDSLAGAPVETGKKTAQFSEEVWKSSARKDVNAS